MAERLCLPSTSSKMMRPGARGYGAKQQSEPVTAPATGAITAPGTAPNARVPYGEEQRGRGPVAEPRLVVLAPDEARPTVDPDRIPPSILERFDDLQLLGRGGMGTVYRGLDKQLDREVAIKFVHGYDASKFLREARAQARIVHDNVCQIYDVGYADGHPYITMQLVRGQSLSTAARSMTTEEKARVVRDAALALHEAHRLGMVHRDIKPGNIMVERDQNNQWRPFVMDFGLARMMDEQGETMTGHVAGTPAYMAPEQARGEIRKLDRRTDVYALGATLYSMLADRPPFVEEHTWQLLMRISTEEAPPLRNVLPDVPLDLEAIVMKCLEREQGRRYDSARALADDLQRYLDGEPVLARKASIWRRLAPKTRKHKWLVGSMAAISLATSAFVVQAIQARRETAEQARIAQELGEDVKEMQLFMRYAHGLPTHDIERERSVVRQRLADIRSRMEQRGNSAMGRGIARYALGRGHLALQEPNEALPHLLAAKEAGVSSPELEYALGRALVEIHRQKVEEVARIGDEKLRRQALADIETQYKLPALAHLKAAVGSRLEHPAYIQGLVALAENRLEDALRFGREAENAAPWFYEATVLQAEAHLAEGDKHNFVNRFDYGEMNRHYELAMEAYRRAAEVGSSDPVVHEGACKVLYQWIYADSLVGKHDLADMHFREGKEFGDRATKSDIRRPTTHYYRVRIHRSYYNQFRKNEEIGDGLLDTIRLAYDAAERDPSNPLLAWLVGNTWRGYTGYLRGRGQDDEEATKQSIVWYQKALELDPRYNNPARELPISLMRLARIAARRGDDPFPLLHLANEASVHAWNMEPESTATQIGKWHMQFIMADTQFRLGRDPTAALGEAQRFCDELLRQMPDEPVRRMNCAQHANLQAEFALATGGDPFPFLDRADELLGGLKTSSTTFLDTRATIIATRASAELSRGRSPEDYSVQSIRAWRATGEEGSWKIGSAVLARLSWHVPRKTATAEMFDEPLELLQPMLQHDRVNPEPFVVAAAIYAYRAAWLADKRMDPSKDLTEGLRLIDGALTRGRRNAAAFAVRGQLHLVQANTSKTDALRQNAALLAKESFDTAIELNRYLAWEIKEWRKQAEASLGAKGN